VAQGNGDNIIGIWLTPGKEPAKIQVFRSDNSYYGKIVWLKNATENGKPRVDIHNPDQSKRTREVLGLLILSDFKFKGENEWESGKIYDPESGKTYSCILSLIDKGTLKVRGYVGISWFGRTEIWTKTSL
jgi:uncharacterized protein (DUF2147 family)